MQQRYITRLPWFVHPVMCFVPSAVGSSIFVIYVLTLLRLNGLFQSWSELGATTPLSQQFRSNWTLPGMWTGLAVGLVIGLLVTAVMFYVCRKTRQFQAEILVLPAAQRFRWRITWRQFLHVLPLMIAQLVLAGLVSFGLLSFAAISASFIPLGLGYFEYKKVYEAAKSKIRNHTPNAGDSSAIG